jgi:sulfite reductase alpha subunit-like flavoprotein
MFPKIIFATQTGMSEYYSRLLGRNLYERGIDSHVISIQDYKIEDLQFESQPLIFICSTTGQGAVPSCMKRFWLALLNNSFPLLPLLQFSIFGLGDSSYEYYNFASRRLLRRLEQLGAHLFSPRGEGDEQAAIGIDEGFFAWASGLFDALKASIIVKPINGPIFNIQKSKESLPLIRGKLEGQILRNVRITASDHFQDTRLLGIGFEGNFLDYEPGDVAVLYPNNDPETVQAFANLLGWDLKQNLIISENYSFSPLPTPSPISLKTLLSEYFDLNGPPTRSFFATLAKFVNSSAEREKLLEISQPEGYDIYLEYCYRPRRTPLEILNDFSSVSCFPVEFIFDLLSPIKPRSFSIASFSKEKIELCVAVVRYQNKNIRAERVGLFSQFLEKLQVGDSIRLDITKGDIQIPEHPPKLILMAAGTGIAPMRSIIQKYSHITDINLFFGCRNIKKDYYFGDEFNSIQVFVKGSRDKPTKKVYLQDILQENSKLIIDSIKSGAILVLAGNTKLPIEVKKVLHEIFVKEGIFQNISQSKIFFNKLCKQNRFQIESW